MLIPVLITFAVVGAAAFYHLTSVQKKRSKRAKQKEQGHAIPKLTPKQQQQYNLVSTMIRYRDVAEPNPSLDTIAFPRYIIIGDQSTGKTSILSRLARMPLGFTGNRTGTKRPFEYVLQYDRSNTSPLIKVNGKQCAQAALFSNLKRLNDETDGNAFSEKIVRVEIHSSFVQNLILVDMPGLKDVSVNGSDHRMPKEMIKSMLKDANTIPVVLLEPRDTQQTHRVYQVLQDAGRCYGDIMVLVNKIDEKIQHGAQWDSPMCWKDYWVALQAKGFKSVFFAGWPSQRTASFAEDPGRFLGGLLNSEPPLNRDEEGDQDEKTRLLVDSFALEEEALKAWGARMQRRRVALPVNCMGLSKFAEALAQDQRAHVDGFTQACSDVLAEIESLEAQRNAQAHQEYVDNVIANKLTSEVFKLVVEVCNRILAVTDGDFLGDLSCKDGFTDLDEDFKFLIGEGDALDGSLSSEFHAFCAKLGFSEERMGVITTVLTGILNSKSLRQTLASNVEDATKKLSGGALFKRDESLFGTWSWYLMLEQMHQVTEDTVKNYLGKGKCEGTGNFVIRKEAEVVIAKSLEPMMDIVTVLLRKHIFACVKRAFYEVQSMSKHSSLFRKYKDTSLSADFKQAFEAIIDKRLIELNEDLHKNLSRSLRSHGAARLQLIKPELAQTLVDNRTGFTPEANSLLGRACLALDQLKGLCLAIDDFTNCTTGKYFLCATKLMWGNLPPIPALGDILKQIEFTQQKEQKLSVLRMLKKDEPQVVEESVDVVEQVTKEVHKDSAEELRDHYKYAQMRLTQSAHMVQGFDLRALQLQFSCVVLAHHSSSVEHFGSILQLWKDTLRKELVADMNSFFNEHAKKETQRASLYTANFAADYQRKKEQAAYRYELLQEARKIVNLMSEAL